MPAPFCVSVACSTMFDSLSDRLQGVVKKLRGKGRLTEADVDAAVRDIRVALLDADVALPVVREFCARVKEQALSTELAGSMNPAQHVVKIVHAELVRTLGGQARRLSLARVLLRERARVVILDEPFAGVDAAMAARIAGSARLRSKLAISAAAISSGRVFGANTPYQTRPRTSG